jgi:hypothetical protein
MHLFTRKFLVGLATLSTASTLGVNPAQAASSGQIYNPNSGRCVGIASGLAGIWNCTTNNDQTWHWGQSYPNWSSYRQLINGNNKCLGAQGSGLVGARIDASTCDGGYGQYWYYNSSSLTVENFGSTQVMGVSGGSTANGAAVVQWTSNGNPDQRWDIYF